MNWRRDHNRRRIQQNSQNTDDTTGKPDHQILDNKPSITSRTRMVSGMMWLVLAVAAPVSVQAGFFSNFFTNAKSQVVPVNTVATVNAVDVSLLAALQNPTQLGARGGAEIVVDDNALVSSGPIGADEMSLQKTNLDEIRVYTVRPGDSLSQVAEMFGVTTNTIMWANDLTRATAIKPGDTLVILPIVGVKHDVKKGETLSSIAQKYDGDVDEILEYNQLASATELSVGDQLIIPGGTMSTALVRTVAQPVSVSGVSAGSSFFSHPVPGAIRTQGIHGHNAVDLASSIGTPIRAAAAGKVIVSKNSGWNGGYGQYIVIKHSNGTQTLYAHLSSNAVGVGDYVAQGEVIGGMGSTGRSTGSHLHFEVRGAANPF